MTPEVLKGKQRRNNVNLWRFFLQQSSRQSMEEEEGKRVKQKQTRLLCCMFPQPPDNSTAINNQSLIFLACLVASVFLFHLILCLSFFFLSCVSTSALNMMRRHEQYT